MERSCATAIAAAAPKPTWAWINRLRGLDCPLGPVTGSLPWNDDSTLTKESVGHGESMKRRRSAMMMMALIALTTASCDLNPVATEDDEPIETDSTVFSFLQLQSDLDEALNIVFVPDNSYGDQSVLANRQAFLDDLGDVVDTGYWQNQAFVLNVHLTNFFYMTARGSVAAPPAGTICPTVTWPAEVSSDAAFADMVLLIHTNVLRDCSSGNRATTEPDSFRTIVHESSHALFGLPDEYCCDGGYWEVPPVLYNTANECETDPANVAWRDCESFTSSGGTSWWRSENATDDIMSVGGSVVLEYGRADWVVVRAVLDDLGSPNNPTVFAPANWDRP